jgi:CHAT domain-containing protein
LHVACHGVFPADRPFDAALRIGAEAIRASELFAVRLNARLVTLSACALGRHARRWGERTLVADEWIGLYLPLFYAGAQSLVVSLWDADSRTAAEFMTALHGEMAAGADAPDAVQSAIRRVRKKLTPLWANWCLVGFPQLEPEADG